MQEELYKKLYNKSSNNGIFKNLYKYIIDKRNVKESCEILNYQCNTSLYKDVINSFMDFSFNMDGKYKTYFSLIGKEMNTFVPNKEFHVTQQCLKNILYPIIEAKLYYNNYGYRKEYYIEHAVANIYQRINLGKLHFILKIDYTDFKINDNILLKILWNNGIRDKKILALIKKCILPNIDKCSILQPLIINIYLNELDWWIAKQWDLIKTKNNFDNKSNKLRSLKTTNLKRGYIMRRGLETIVFSDSLESAYKWKYSVHEFLEMRLKLDSDIKIINVRKSKFDLLGYSFWVDYKSDKYICESKICKESRKYITKQVKKFIKITSLNNTSYAADIFNTNIINIHNYYRYATFCNRDFNKIWNDTRHNFYNSFKNNKSIRLNIAIKKSKHSSYNNLDYYKNYNIKTFSIDNIPLVPICTMIHKKPMNRKYDFNIYNEK